MGSWAQDPPFFQEKSSALSGGYKADFIAEKPVFILDHAVFNALLPRKCLWLLGVSAKSFSAAA